MSPAKSTPTEAVAGRSQLDLGSLREFILDDRVKGIPGGVEPFPLAELGKKGWNVLKEDLPLPLLVMKQAALEHNSRVFSDYMRQHGLSFAPHGKTTMTPQIFAQQFADGAWGLTAATVSQLQVFRHYGVGRVLLANQLVGRQNVRYVVEQLNADPEFDFYCFVDSVELVNQLAARVREFGGRRPVKVLVELGIKGGGGRAGCRTVAEALVVVRAVRASAGALALAGVAGYEGIVPGMDAEALAGVDAHLKDIRDFLGHLTPDDFTAVKEVIITAGGTAYFDRVAEIFPGADFALPVRPVVRSGCYITHDTGGYRKYQDLALEQQRNWCEALEPALEVWSYVQSIPEPGLALLTMGKRDCPYDTALPLPERRFRPRGEEWLELSGGKAGAACEIFSTNDQHAYLRFPEGLDLRVGDMIASGISHPCTAFDKWKFIPVVNAEYDVIDGVLTFF